MPATESFSGSRGGEGVISGCDLDDARPVSLRSYVAREVEKASSKAAFKKTCLIGVWRVILDSGTP